jgi:hypothetical protein
VVCKDSFLAQRVGFRCGGVDYGFFNKLTINLYKPGKTDLLGGLQTYKR